MRRAKLSDEDVEDLNRKIEQLWHSRVRFKKIVALEHGARYKTRISKEVPPKPGVYVINENKTGNIIYVGSTGKNDRTLAQRLYELFYYNPNNPKASNRTSHTLTYKLVDGSVGRFSDGRKVREFYRDECSVRYVPTEDVLEAKLIEDLLIRKLRPCYNY